MRSQKKSFLRGTLIEQQHEESHVRAKIEGIGSTTFLSASTRHVPGMHSKLHGWPGWSHMYAVALDSSGTSCEHSRGEATLRPTVWYRLSIVRSHHEVASSLYLNQSADEDHRPCMSSCGSISSVTATLRPCERIWCHHPSAAGEREGVNHVLVMLYHSEVCRVCYCAKGGGACVARKYRTAVTEFYRLAAKLNQSSTARISVGEMDLLVAAQPVGAEH